MTGFAAVPFAVIAPAAESMPAWLSNFTTVPASIVRARSIKGRATKLPMAPKIDRHPGWAALAPDSIQSEILGVVRPLNGSLKFLGEMLSKTAVTRTSRSSPFCASAMTHFDLIEEAVHRTKTPAASPIWASRTALESEVASISMSWKTVMPSASSLVLTTFARSLSVSRL